MNNDNKKPASKRSPAADKKARRTKKAHKFPVEPIVIQTVSKGRGYMNHSYRDFSVVPAEVDWEMPSKMEDMSFAEKVHDILNNEEYSKVITWMPHGRAFKVIVPVVFERLVCIKYFGHKRYSSFLRQLNNHGFKHVSKGPDRNCYYHECMLRNMAHLTKYMPEPKDARRQIPDPDNEPDLYKISRAYPLQHEAAGVQQLPVQQEPQSLLQTRLASEVPWLSEPPAKRAAPSPSFAAPSLLSSLAAPQQMSTAGLLPQQQQNQSVLASLANQQLESSLRERALLAALQRQQQTQQQLQLFGLQPDATTPSNSTTIGEFLRMQAFR